MRAHLVIAGIGLLGLPLAAPGAEEASRGLPDWALGPFSPVTAASAPLPPQSTAVFACPLAEKPVAWEAAGTLFAGAAVRDGKLVFLYEAVEARAGGGKVSRLGLADSSDGVTSRRLPAPVLFPAADDERVREWPGGCADPHLIDAENNGWVLLYTQQGDSGPWAAAATSRDLVHWEKTGPIFGRACGGRYAGLKARAGSVICRQAGDRLVAARIAGRYWMYWRSSGIGLATSADLLNWDPVESEPGQLLTVLQPHSAAFDAAGVVPGPALLTEKGIVLVHTGFDAAGNATISEALFDANAPARLLVRLTPPVATAAADAPRPSSYVARSLVWSRNRWLLFVDALTGNNVSVAVLEKRVPPAADWPAEREFGPFQATLDGSGIGYEAPLGDDAPLSRLAPWSFSFWVRAEREPANFTLLAGFGDAQTAEGNQRFLAAAADGLHFWGGYKDLLLGTRLAANRWQRLTATFDGSELTVYQDGNPVFVHPLTVAWAAPLVRLGPAAAGQSGSGFTGQIADFRLWNRALSPTQVQKLQTLVDPAVLRFPAAPALPERKAKRAPAPLCELRTDTPLALRQNWALTPVAAELTGVAVSQPGLRTDSWYDATVPGTVLTTLVEQGVLPDPYFGLNNLLIPDLYAGLEYWYRTEFGVADFAAPGRRLRLLFNGINYRAEVWLNGTRLGTIDGAFCRGEFDVTDHLRRGKPNALAVRITPPPTAGTSHEQSFTRGVGLNGGVLTKDGPTFFASMGWDWIPGIRDRCAGIWQDVLLVPGGPIVLGDPQVVTDLPLPSTASADLTIRAELINTTASEQHGTLHARIGSLAIAQPVTLLPGERHTFGFAPAQFPELTVREPRLWWPNGYGEPSLYTLELSVSLQDGSVSDHRQMRFGIRELEYELNPQLTITVNGQRIFCKGGNWGMDEAMKRASRDRLEACIRFHRDAHMTMIRNWTGQSTEEDFYDLCDEYGILVFNDFWLANPVDGPDPADTDLFLVNAADTIRRFRNHPCIALWCGRNEGVPPVDIDQGLRDLLKELDGTRLYLSHSAADPLCGYGPYQYTPPAEYFTRHARGFKTEIGLPSVPSADSMRAMLPEAYWWPINNAWAYHDFTFAGAQNCRGYLNTLETQFGKAETLDDFCRKAQMLNYDGYRAVFEAWNSKLWNDCSGVLLWMSHPAWPSTVWQLYAHDLEPTAALFGAMKACEPVHVQMSPADGMLAVVNNTFEPLTNALLTARIFNADGTFVMRQEIKVTADANACTSVTRLNWPERGLTPARFVKLELRAQGGTLLADNFYWNAANEKDLQELTRLPRVTLTGTLRRAAGKAGPTWTCELRNRSPNVALMTKLTLRNADTGQRILPAFYSDNYLSLLPGEAKTVRIECRSADLGAATPTVTVDGWNLEPVALTP